MPGLSCTNTTCEYNTASQLVDVPVGQQLELLKLHTQAVHLAAAHQGGQNTGQETEKLPKPKLKLRDGTDNVDSPSHNMDTLTTSKDNSMTDISLKEAPGMIITSQARSVKIFEVGKGPFKCHAINQEGGVLNQLIKFRLGGRRFKILPNTVHT